MKILSAILALLWLASCSGLGGSTALPEGVECLSLTGGELRQPELSAEREAELAANLQAARADLAAKPGDEMAAIWVGRRLGYLGRYNDAIATYTEALETHAESFRLHRHRGHRHISLRQFPQAVADLQDAARLARGVPDEYEKDGAPNAFGIPRSTTHSNIYYHLALALFLERDFEASLEAWQRCLYFSRVNDDMLVAATYWTVITHWRLFQTAEADRLLGTIRPEMDILENHDYHRLLLLFKGELDEEEVRAAMDGGELGAATTGFGLGTWHQHQGRNGRANEYYARVIRDSFWPAFGHIAAEVELADR